MTTPTPADRAAERIRSQWFLAHPDEPSGIRDDIAQIITREFAPMVEACREALWAARSHVNDLGHLEQIDKALSLLNPKASD